MGLAARGYYSSPRSTDPFLESQLDLRDETGATMPGYGWVFPLGDGTVNVGVGLLTTSEEVEARQHHPDDGGLRPNRTRTTGAFREETKLTEPVGGKADHELFQGTADRTATG